MSTKRRQIAGVPVGFVKGGTTSSAWDAMKAKQYDDSDRRRAHQDRQRSAVAHAAQDPRAKSALFSMQLHSDANPKIVLNYKAKDSALDQECIGNFTVVPTDGEASEPGLVLVLVCPKCLERTGRQDDAQVMVKSWEKQLWLDDSKKGVWINHVDGSVHHLAGTLTVKDICSCTALGCNWRFRIDDSVLYGSHHFAL